MGNCPLDSRPFNPDNPRVQLERYPASADSDTATAQTVSLMSRYIRESAEDPGIQNAARCALDHFGAGSDTPAMKAWAVFWFVKHFLRFVVDEAPMMRLGRPNEQDLLISPAVLIRMRDPAEDCDGFTMLSCALLKALDVPFVIVTVAASPDDPSRWSHVFCMAMLPAGPLPMDTSHGSGPGWMVPAQHTFRWQSWNENGEQVNIPRPRKHGLNGWISTGLGQTLDDLPSDVSTPVSDPFSLSSLFGDLSTPSPGYALPSTGGFLQSTQPPASSSTGFNVTSFLNNLTADAAATTNAYFKAQTAQQLAQAGAYGTSNLLGTVMPILMIGLGIWFVTSMMGKK